MWGSLRLGPIKTVLEYYYTYIKTGGLSTLLCSTAVGDKHILIFEVALHLESNLAKLPYNNNIFYYQDFFCVNANSSDSKYMRPITKLAIQTLSFEVQAWRKFR